MKINFWQRAWVMTCAVAAVTVVVYATGVRHPVLLGVIETGLVLFIWLTAWLLNAYFNPPRCTRHGERVTTDHRHELRCTGCGHRVSLPGAPEPQRSSHRPPWTWPGELWARRAARRGT